MLVHIQKKYFWSKFKNIVQPIRAILTYHLRERKEDVDDADTDRNSVEGSTGDGEILL